MVAILEDLAWNKTLTLNPLTKEELFIVWHMGARFHSSLCHSFPCVSMVKTQLLDVSDQSKINNVLLFLEFCSSKDTSD